jgi:ABC-type xylose transport system substrate-binding protein
MVEKAKKAGVKVVVYEARILNTDLEIFVTFDHLMAGELQGRFLITKVPKGNYIIMYANGKMYVPTVLITPILIDRSNIDDVLIKSSYFTIDEVYGS